MAALTRAPPSRWVSQDRRPLIAFLSSASSLKRRGRRPKLQKLLQHRALRRRVAAFLRVSSWVGPNIFEILIFRPPKAPLRALLSTRKSEVLGELALLSGHIHIILAPKRSDRYGLTEAATAVRPEEDRIVISGGTAREISAVGAELSRLLDSAGHPEEAARLAADLRESKPRVVHFESVASTTSDRLEGRSLIFPTCVSRNPRTGIAGSLPQHLP